MNKYSTLCADECYFPPVENVAIFGVSFHVLFINSAGRLNIGQPACTQVAVIQINLKHKPYLGYIS